eukprot:s1211_g7.t1
MNRSETIWWGEDPWMPAIFPPAKDSFDPFQALAADVAVGILLEADPSRPALNGPSWPSSPAQVPYLELAARAEAQQKPFDAWLLYGKAAEAANGAAGDLFRRRALAAMAAHLETCAVADASKGVEFGDAAARAAAGFVVQSLEAVGRRSEAVAAAAEGAKLLKGSPLGTTLEEGCSSEGGGIRITRRVKGPILLGCLLVNGQPRSVLLDESPKVFRFRQWVNQWAESVWSSF